MVAQEFFLVLNESDFRILILEAGNKPEVIEIACFNSHCFAQNLCILKKTYQWQFTTIFFWFNLDLLWLVGPESTHTLQFFKTRHIFVIGQKIFIIQYISHEG